MSDNFDPFASGLATESVPVSGDGFEPFASGQATEAPERDWRKKESMSEIFTRSKATAKAGTEARRKEREQAWESLKNRRQADGDLLSIDEAEGRAMNENEQLRAAAIPGGVGGIGRYSGFGQVGEYLYNKPQRFDIAAEAGIPLVAQILTTELSPAAQSAVGAGASVLGNTLAQGRRVLAGEQESFQLGQTAQAATLGAVPVAGPLKAGVTAARPLVSITCTTLKTAAKMGAAGAIGETLRTGIDEGRLPSSEELSFATAVPTAFTLMTLPAQLGGAALAKGAQTLADRAKIFAKAGVRPTPAMLYPEKFASLEREMAERGAAGMAGKVGRAYDDLGAYTESLYPNVEGKAELFNEVAPLLGRVSTAKDQVAKLDDAARAAFQAKEEALTRLNKVIATGDRDSIAAAYEDALKARDAAFQSAWSSTLKNAQDLQVLRQTEGYMGWTPAQQRTFAVEHFIEPSLGLLDEYVSDGYRAIETATPIKGFNTSSIVKEADDVLAKLTTVKETAEGEVQKAVGRKSDSAMALVKAAFGEGKEVSLQDLRNVRDDLVRRVRMGALDSSAEEHAIKGVISRITDTIGKQAKDVYGEELGQQLLNLNDFYRRKAKVLDGKGVSLLHSKEATDAAITTITRGMLEGNGIAADEYKNLSKVADLVEEINPMAGAAVRSHFRSAIREGVINSAVSGFDAQAGKALVDGGKLTEALGKLARQPGTLEELGLGNPESLGRLQTLFKRYPEASQMTQEQITQLIESPAFRDGKAQFYATVDKAFAANQAENQLKRAAYLRKSGDEEAAVAAYAKAKETLQGVTTNQDAAKRRLAELMDDPSVVALDKFQDKDLDGFLRTFRTATSEERKAAAAALPESLKDRIEQRALADFFGELDRKMPRGLSEEATGLDVAKVNKLLTSGSSEAVDNLRYFDDFLSPERKAKLRDIAEVSGELMRYERMGQRRVQEITGKAELGGGAVGGERRYLEMANYWLQRKQYDIAAWMALEGEAAQKGFAKGAAMAGAAGEVIKEVSDILSRPVRLAAASLRASGERARGVEASPEESPIQKWLQKFNTSEATEETTSGITPEQEAQFQSLLQQLRSSASPAPQPPPQTE